jgi:hypothetical protein
MSANDDANSEPLWTRYSGRPNTTELIREKAQVVAKLISMLLDTGESLAPKMLIPPPEFGAREKILAKAEIAAYCLYIVDNFAFKLLSPSERDELMSTLEEHTIENLGEMGMNRSEFVSLVQARYAEYSTYKKWVAKPDESSKGTLTWEFAKKVAAILGLGKHALFNVALSTLIGEHLKRIDLPTLLKG